MFKGLAVRDEAVAGKYGAKSTLRRHRCGTTGCPPQQGEPQIFGASFICVTAQFLSPVSHVKLHLHNSPLSILDTAF